MYEFWIKKLFKHLKKFIFKIFDLECKISIIKIILVNAIHYNHFQKVFTVIWHLSTYCFSQCPVYIITSIYRYSEIIKFHGVQIL